jgi:hypothetical protein
MSSPRRSWVPLTRPGIIIWLLAAVAIGAAGYNDPLPTRLLAGVLMALPALLRLAFLVGRKATDPRGDAAPAVYERPAAPEPPELADPRDPLRRPWVARSVTVVILVTAAAALTLSLVAGAPRTLPDVALSSPALLHLLRTAVATIAVALLALFAVRAMAGYFPQKLSTTSAEWPATTAVAASSQATLSAAGSLQDLREVVEGLGRDLDEHKAQQLAQRHELVQSLVDPLNQQGRTIAALQGVVLRLDPDAEHELGASDAA